MKWGIMATGRIACKFANTILAMKKEGEEVIAVASRSEERAQEFGREFHVERCYDSYEQLAQDEEVEAVYIATPNALHYDNAKMCLEHGKHVLCEKPFTIEAAQAEELYTMAAAKGLFIMEALWISFLPALLKMQEIIRSGEIGEVKYARSEFGFLLPDSRRKRKFQAELGGGALLDIGIYNIAFLNMAMGDMPTGFQSFVHKNEYQTDDFSTIALQYGQDRIGVMTTAIGLQIDRKAVVTGTKGSITLPDFQKAEELHVRTEDGQTRVLQFPFDINGFEYQIRELKRCVAWGKTDSTIYTPQMSLSILKLMDAIRKEWGIQYPPVHFR